MISLQKLAPLGGIVVATILVVGGVLMATNVWNPSWNPFHSKANIEQAILKTLQAKTISFDTSLVLNGTTDNNQSVKLNFLASQKVDERDEKNPKKAGVLTIGMDIQGINFSLKVGFKALDKKFYLSFQEIPSALAMFLGGIDINSIKNQWYSVDLSSIETSNETVNNQEMLQDLSRIIEGKKIFRVKKRVGKKVLDSQKAVHYTVEVDKNTVKQVVPEIFKMLKTYVPKDQKESYEKNLNEFLKNFSDNFESVWQKLSPLVMDIWITEKGYVARLRVEKEFKDIPIEGQTLNSLKVSFQIDCKDFNKPVTIEAPSSSQPIENLLKQLGMNNLEMPLQ